jgi:hypothetical protein
MTTGMGVTGTGVMGTGSMGLPVRVCDRASRTEKGVPTKTAAILMAKITPTSREFFMARLLGFLELRFIARILRSLKSVSMKNLLHRWRGLSTTLRFSPPAPNVTDERILALIQNTT